VVLGAVLECGKAKFIKNFIVYVLDGIKAILRNTFIHVYSVDVLRKGFKLKVIVKLVDRFVCLEVEYQGNLTKVGIHLVSLQELQETSFLILMCVDEFNTKSEAKGAKSWPICISNTINKTLDILMDKLPKHLLFSRNVDRKIEVVFGSAPDPKSLYRLNI
jgi:hypothetical protein